MWNWSTFDYESCVCKKTLVDKLVEECTSVIEENKIYIVSSSSDCSSCTVYVVLFVVFLLLYLITSGLFVYFYWYLVFIKVDGYFLCADNGMKYLTFAPTEKNKEMLENYKKLWDEVKEEIRTIKGASEPFEYENNYMKCRFESEYGLPMGKTVNIPLCVIIARPVFEDSGKFYPQVYLERCYLEYYKGESANGSYYCFKTPLSINNSEYGKYLLKKRVVNFVTTDFNSL